MIFKKRGERLCNVVVKKLTKLPRRLKRRGINGKVHINNCRQEIKLLACTLNPKGLEWVRKYKHIAVRMYVIDALLIDNIRIIHVLHYVGVLAEKDQKCYT